MNQINNLNRREFLKLLSLLTITTAGMPLFEILPDQPAQKVDDGKQRPNILLLLFDTLSAAHLSFFGYPRETTPHLARFAERAVVYHRHYSAGNYTVPATASLLTGTYPWSHRGLHFYGTTREEYLSRNLFSGLGRYYHTSAFTHNAFVMGLLDQFSQHVDQIIPAKDLAILSQPAAEDLFPADFSMSFWGERIIRASGSDWPGSLFLSFIGKDFDPFTPEELRERYGQLYPRGLPNNTLGLFFLLEDAIDWIIRHVMEQPRPFFSYIHLFPPHEPYMTRRDYVDIFNDGWEPQPKPVLAFPQDKTQEDLNESRRHYDEYLAFVDAEFGRLYDSLEAAGVLDNTILIITSDHGQLIERRIHGHVTSTLYDPLIHIPLMISKPGQKERQDIHEPTSIVDLLPTLFHIAGVESPDWSEGTVLPGFGPSQADAQRSVYVVEAKNNPKLAPLEKGTFSMIKGRYKLIRYFGYPGKEDDYEFYDLENDPEERENLASQRSRQMPELKDELITRLNEINREYEA